MIDCDCPRCGSRNTKAFSALHHDGARDAHYRRNGWFYFRRSFGVQGSTTRGRSQTLTSQIASPPVPTVTRFLQGGGVPLLLILGALAGGPTGFLVGLAVLVALAVAFGKQDLHPHDQRLREWSSSFRCNRCGTVFAIIESAEQHTTN